MPYFDIAGLYHMGRKEAVLAGKSAVLSRINSMTYRDRLLDLTLVAAGFGTLGAFQQRARLVGTSGDISGSVFDLSIKCRVSQLISYVTIGFPHNFDTIL